MYKQKLTKTIEIAQKFDLKIIGDQNKVVTAPGSLTRKSDQFLYWLKDPKYASFIDQGTLIIRNDHFSQIEKNPNVCYLITEDNPRATFSKVLTKHFPNLGLKLCPNQVDQHRRNPNITISDYVFIGEDVTIGDGTIVYPNVVIHNNTVIGSNCLIKSNCSIATEGLGFEMEEGEWVKFPQIGGVTLGNNVEMGPNSTIRRGALDNTIIEDGVKIGSFINIGHNCVIGKNSILTCQCVTGGSTVLGKDVYMGIQSMTKNGVKVGDNAVIGAGAIVVKNVPNNLTVIGSPAKSIDEYKKWSDFQKSILNQDNST